MHAIQQFQDKHDIVIVIGDESSREEDNPLNFKERKDLIEECVDLEIRTLENNESDKVWAEKLVEMTDADAVISRNEWTLEAVREYTDIKILKQDYRNKDLYSGTEIRRRIRSGEEWRYLIPDCSEDKLQDYLEIIKKSGTQYEFEPGWKKENAFHDTAKD